MGVTSHSATCLHSVEFIRLWLVASGILVPTSSVAMQSCLAFAGNESYCCTRWSEAPKTLSLCDTSGEYAGMFSLSRRCGQILTMLQHEAMATDEWHDNRPWFLSTFKLPSIKRTCVHCPLLFSCGSHNPTTSLTILPTIPHRPVLFFSANLKYSSTQV